MESACTWLNHRSVYHIAHSKLDFSLEKLFLMEGVLTINKYFAHVLWDFPQKKIIKFLGQLMSLKSLFICGSFSSVYDWNVLQSRSFEKQFDRLNTFDILDFIIDSHKIEDPNK